MIHYRTKQDAQSSHQQILRIVKQLNASPILDVGSAQGMLGENLIGSGLHIDAIEPHPQWAHAATAFYRTVHNCTIESAPLEPGQYRCIVCADVLEHLADPISALGRLRASAMPGATFIVSVPNVAHLSVRLLLLAGLFPRMERGILDRTHLQFFTRATATAMLERAGLSVRSVSATPVPIEQITQSKALNIGGGLLQRAMIRLMPALFAFQWVFVAKEKEPDAHPK
jgi:2-polyprenyl-3-methyl-5-hydroxy-6-metoxy-1,4-benzoquinol methylase